MARIEVAVSYKVTDKPSNRDLNNWHLMFSYIINILQSDVPAVFYWFVNHQRPGASASFCSIHLSVLLLRITLTVILTSSSSNVKEQTGGLERRLHTSLSFYQSGNYFSETPAKDFVLYLSGYICITRCHQGIMEMSGLEVKILSHHCTGGNNIVRLNDITRELDVD